MVVCASVHIYDTLLSWVLRMVDEFIPFDYTLYYIYHTATYVYSFIEEEGETKRSGGVIMIYIFIYILSFSCCYTVTCKRNLYTSEYE
jgi:hypothetical protein